MSAQFAKEDRQWLLNHQKKQNKKLNDLDEATVLMVFDNEVSFDIQIIETRMRETAFLRKVALYKLALLIPEYILASLFFTKKYRENKVRLAKVYWKFYRNKIDYAKAQKELHEIIKDGTI